MGRLPKRAQTGVCPFREVFFFSLKGSNVIVWCLLIRAKRILPPLEALKNICSKIQFLSKQTKACSALTIIPSMSSALFQVLGLKKRKKKSAPDFLSSLSPTPQYIYLFSTSSTPSAWLPALPREGLFLRADSSFFQTEELVSRWCCSFLYFKFFDLMTETREKKIKALAKFPALSLSDLEPIAWTSNVNIPIC